MRWDFFSSRALNDVNRLCYWVALPVLLFHRIGGTTPDFAAAGGLLIVVVGATLLGILAAGAYAWVAGVARASRGAFIQGAFRGNTVFVGLPVVLYAFDAAGASTTGAESVVLLILGPLLVIYNITAVVLLSFSSGAVMNRQSLREAAFGVLVNPILLGCMAGLLFSASGAALPAFADRTLGTLGSMAFPLALICIGGALYLTPIRGSLALATISALMKVALLPIIGLGLAVWMELGHEEQVIAVILLASPTAAASYVLTRQLNGDDAMASGVILLSHLLAIPAFAILLMLLR